LLILGGHFRGVPWLVHRPTYLFFYWWAAASARVDGQVQKGMNSIIILGAWSIWKYRNRCVFDGAPPEVSCVVSAIKEELHQWTIAGARGVSYLLALGAHVV